MLRVAVQLARGGAVSPNRADRGIYAGKKIVYGWKLADDKFTPKR
jgi:hypothetical protein